MTDTQTTIGKVHSESFQRDAIHIAVYQVVCACAKLYPGDPIGLINSNNAIRMLENSIGIVDPYLPRPVMEGEKFWMFLYPNTIKTLRHHWVHNKINDNEQAEDIKAKAIKWFEAHENTFGFYTKDLLRAAEMGDFDSFGFSTTAGPEWAQMEEFWDKLQQATGIEFSEKIKRDTYFHCSC